MPEQRAPIRTIAQPVENFTRAERYLQARSVHEAIAAYNAAESEGYDADACAGARWVCYMLLGDYKRAWAESKAIEKRGRPDPHRFWRGESLVNKHVIVRCLHGLGDTLQYVRYAPLIRAVAASLTIETQPPLKTLIAGSGLADRVITWRDAEPAWDAQLEVVQLPRIFETTVRSIPQQIPYLKVPRAKMPLSRDRFHVGLVWAAGSYNPARSIPLATLRRICTVTQCEFFSFQNGEDRAQLAECNAQVCDLSDDGPVLTTASRLVNMDLVITVDTMTAHLAGALGLQVWTLLPFEADWRWMLDRSDSPWYPTMRLFRQPRQGNWDSVLDQVVDELTLVAARAA